MSESKYGRLFTEMDMETLAQAAFERGVKAGRVMEGLGDEPDPPGLLTLLADTRHRLTFPADEPLFLLRAQDRAAAATVGDYGVRAAQEGAAKDHVAAVREAARAFLIWRHANPDRVKVPD